MEHYQSANHPENHWTEVLQYIPKESNTYTEQFRTLTGRIKQRDLTILDVGTGDGSFAETVVKHLQTNHNVTIDFIEKNDNLRSIAAELLSESLESSPLHAKVRELKFETGPLLEQLDTLPAPQYDVILLSHVTYYFSESGTALVYGLATRLLKEGGVIWVIARDRTCPLYKAREELLAKHKATDPHRESFSDCLLDRLRCISSDISTSCRSSALQPPDDPTLLLEYLWWMKLDTPPHISDWQFTESHIFLGRLNRIAETVAGETAKLRQASLVASCIDVVRRSLPDITVLRVSMARIFPQDAPQNPESARARPRGSTLRPSNFEVDGLGYRSGNGDDKFTPAGYSLMFHPAFYDDPSTGSGAWKELKTSGSPFEQTRPLTPKGHPDYPGHGELEDALAAWHSYLEDDYLPGATMPGAAPHLSVCVGATLVPDIYRHENELSGTCGFFLTYSSTTPLSLETRPAIRNQLRTLVTQWLGYTFYTEAQAQVEEIKRQTAILKRQADMLAVVRGPVRRISEALERLQTDTQETRAILLDPEESLFASHAEIAPFFVNGTLRGLALSDAPNVRIHHTVEDYWSQQYHTSLRIVLACVICSVFGELNTLKQCTSVAALMTGFSEAVRRAKASPSFAPPCETLAWLLAHDNDGTEEDLEFWLTPKVTIAQQIVGLGNLKDALYRPFKPEEKVWKTLPFLLLCRNAKLSPAARDISDMTNAIDSPVSFAAVLAFLSEVVAGATRPFKRFAVSESAVTLEWASRPAELLQSKDFIRRLCKQALESPRDWRYESGSYGDTTRPFVMLANKCMNVAAPTALGGNTSWTVVDATGKDVLHLQQGNKRVFKVSLSKAPPTEGALILTWGKLP